MLRRPHLSLELLHTFLTVAELEHVTHAAETLNLSQAAVSRQLRALEEVLDCQLFERWGRGVRLTPLGQQLRTAATDALRAAEAVEHLAASQHSLDSGRLTVAASNTVGVHWLPTLLAAFADLHPRIDVRLELDNTEGALRRLLDGSVDCAVVEGAATAPHLQEAVVERDELVLVAAADHPLACLPTVHPDDLRAHRYLARERGSGTEALAARVIGESYREGPTFELGGAEAVRAGVLAGLGYAVVSSGVVAEDVALGKVVVLDAGRAPVLREFRALRRTGASMPVLEAFWAHLLAGATRMWLSEPSV